MLVCYLGPVDLLIFISLITDMTSFSVAGFRKNELSITALEIIFATGISVDDLTIISLAIVTMKLLNLCHNFGIRFSLIVYVYRSDLLMRVCHKTDNRSNPIPGFFRVAFMFFKIVLLVI